MENTAAQAWRSRLRGRYRPDRVRLLFIGESPPASGRFFYNRDSGLYRAIRDAFLLIDSSITDANFLDRFKASGCFLTDTCPYPVDRMDPKSRRAACLEGEAKLSRTIKRLQPDAIVTLVRSVRPIVERATSAANWSGRSIDAPYPGRWIRHREKFLELILPELRSLTPITKSDKPVRENGARG